MADVRGETSAGGAALGARAGKFLGSLKDALVAAGREDSPAAPLAAVPVTAVAAPAAAMAPPLPSAEEAARLARTIPVARVLLTPPEPAIEPDAPPTTRVVRAETAAALKKAPEPLPQDPRTVLVRGRAAIPRTTFAQDPVVGFLIVVGGPGLGSFRPIFEGNNTVGRTTDNRIPLDFGDDTISAEAQAYVRYDSADRSFLFVPNLAKTNVVSVNDKRPSGAVGLKAMDVITFGRTQVAFVPFCGSEFDWSEISET
jgi:hypothetical protein